MRESAFLVVALVVAAGTIPALAQEEGTVVGRPNVELSATDNRFGAGERVTLQVFAANNGDLDRGGPTQYEERVKTARNVRLEVDETRMDPELAREIEVRTGEVFAGSVPEGVSGPFAFDVEFSESVSPGTYEIPIEVTYDYTNFVRYGPNSQPEYGDGSRTQTAFVTVVIEDRPQFEVTTQNFSRVTAGDAKAYRFTVANTGTQTAASAEVSLSAANSSIFFGGLDAPQERTSVFVGRLEPGENRSFEVTVGANADTAPGTYLADAVVTYENPNGISSRSDRLTFGVPVGGEQTFALRNVDSTLTVGDTGVVTGRVVNTGETNANDSVVVLGTENPNFQPRETEYAVGDLSPGESANFRFRVDTANATDAGPRRLDFSVAYRNPDDDARTSEPLSARVAVAREQTFDVRATGSDLRVDDRGTVSGTVVNTGESNVSNAVVVLQTEGTNLRPRETEYAVGDLDPGDSERFDFEVDAPNDTDPGVRQVSFRVRYRNEYGEIRYSDSFDASVAVGGEQTFTLRDVESDLRVGDRGTVSGTVVNTGESNVSDAVVAFGTDNPNLQPRETEISVGDLEPGETADFEFTVDVSNRSDPGPRQLSFLVRHRDRQGDPRVGDELDAQVVVGSEQTFAVEGVGGSLRVGETGDLEGEIANEGERPVSNAVVVLQTDNPNLQPRETEYAVGDLAPGESVPFEFAIDVNSQAEPGPRQVSFRVRYRNQGGDLQVSDTVDARVSVAEDADEFRVEPTDATVAAGSSEVVEFRVTNTANETLRDVEAKLFASDPLSSDNDEAFVPRLDPNESATLKFEVSVAGGSIPKLYPVSMDFSYENERGDAVLSDTYRVPVEVTEPDQRGLGVPAELPAAALAVLGVILAALVVVWWKRGALAQWFS